MPKISNLRINERGQSVRAPDSRENVHMKAIRRQRADDPRYLGRLTSALFPRVAEDAVYRSVISPLPPTYRPGDDKSQQERHGKRNHGDVVDYHAISVLVGAGSISPKDFEDCFTDNRGESWGDYQDRNQDTTRFGHLVFRCRFLTDFRLGTLANREHWKQNGNIGLIARCPVNVSC